MSQGFHYQESSKAKKARLAGWVTFIAMSAVLAGTLVVMGRPEPPPGELLETTPPEVLGRWTTRAERYAGRAMRVEPDRVTLEVGPGMPDYGGLIDAVRTWEEGPVTVVYLEFTTVDGLQTVEMLLEGPGRMRLRNPPDVVWTRSDS